MSYIIDCAEPWWSLIRKGVKTVEGRKATPKWLEIKEGTIVTFRHDKETFEAKVTKTVVYTGVDALQTYLATETLANTLPGVETIEAGMKVYLGFWKMEEVTQYGVLALHILV